MEAGDVGFTVFVGPSGKCLYCGESWYIMGIYLWSAVIFFFKTSQTLIYSEVVFVVIV